MKGGRLKALNRIRAELIRMKRDSLVYLIDEWVRLSGVRLSGVRLDRVWLDGVIYFSLGSDD